MRAPVLSTEFNQLAAYAALRLVTIKVRILEFRCSWLTYSPLFFPLTVWHWRGGHIRVGHCGILDHVASVFSGLCSFLLQESKERYVLRAFLFVQSFQLIPWSFHRDDHDDQSRVLDREEFTTVPPSLHGREWWQELVSKFGARLVLDCQGDGIEKVVQRWWSRVGEWVLVSLILAKDLM